MNSIANTGVDVGNHDTKTQRTTTPSGFSSMNRLPFAVDEYLLYDGVYYVPEMQRFAYVKDKTISENLFILTLFGIAKEIIAQYKEETADVKGRLPIQTMVDTVKKVNLGVGLPPAHCALLTEKTEDYYLKHFSKPVSFAYKCKGFPEVKFNLELNNCRVYPQDVTAALTFGFEEGIKPFAIEYFECCAVDIGGQTLDIVPIIDKRPVVSKCASIEKGILRMYDEMIPVIEREFGVSLTQTNIDAVLNGKRTILEQDVIDAIHSFAREWTNQIINELRQRGIDFSVIPIIFIGGGSLLLRKHIEENTLLKKYQFIPDAKANAQGYAMFIERQSKE